MLANFRDDLAPNNLDAAYDRIAPMTRQAFRKEALAQLAKHPALAPGVEYKTRSTSVSNGLAKVTGQLTGPSGPASYELRATYVNSWKISGLSIDGTPILPPR